MISMRASGIRASQAPFDRAQAASIWSSSPHRTSVGTSIAADALALVGEPHGLGADAIGGGIDARHGLDDLAADLGIGGLGEQHVDACLGHGGQVGLPARLRS